MGAFHTGVYRNLFAEMGKSEAEIQKKISEAAGDIMTIACICLRCWL